MKTFYSKHRALGKWCIFMGDSPSNAGEKVGGDNAFAERDLAYENKYAYIYKISISNCWKYVIHKNAFIQTSARVNFSLMAITTGC